MPKKIIKDIFLKEKRKSVPLSEEIGSNKKRNSFKFIFIFILAALAVGFGAVFLSKVSSASISIILQSEQLDINTDLIINKNNEENLTFETTQMESVVLEPLVATGIANNGLKSSGKIVIYNNYSLAPQKLIATTRFETKDGKVYRIPQAVTVPGMGSVEATVYADAAGESYNIGLVDFTLPGLKGGLRYEKIYAKSKTEMKGGSSGNAKILREEDIASAKYQAAEKIKKEIIADFSQKKPSGYLFYENAVNIEYIDDLNNPKSGDPANSPMVYKVKGVGTGYLFRKDQLSDALVAVNAKRLKRDIKKEDRLKISNIEELKTELINVNVSGKEIKINFKGAASFVWDFNAEDLINDLAGQRTKNYKKILSNYTNVKNAKMIFKPAWWYKLPSNPSKIKITIIDEKKSQDSKKNEQEN